MGAAMAVNGEIRAAVASPTREWLAWSAAVVEDPAAAGWNCWDHEPVRIPLSRPSATLSPAQSGGEGRERRSVHGKPRFGFFPHALGPWTCLGNPKRRRAGALQKLAEMSQTLADAPASWMAVARRRIHWERS